MIRSLIIYFPEQTTNASLSTVSLVFGVNFYLGDLHPGLRNIWIFLRLIYKYLQLFWVTESYCNKFHGRRLEI